jgi:DNA-binding response OmpR family regulator
MSSPLHILLIDDDPNFARSLHASITAVGMRTILSVANDMAAALASIEAPAAETHTPDLILLGLEAPLATRTSMIKELQRRMASQSLPIVVLIDRIEGSSGTDIQQAGAIGLWRRPRNSKAFRTLARLLDRSSDQTPRSRLRTFRDFIE